MELIKAVLLGLLQGIIEFMPISSTGHLALMEQLFSTSYGTEMIFVCILHLSSLIAIIVIFAKDIANLAVAFCGIVIDLVANLFIFIKAALGMQTEGYFVINSSPHRKFLLLLMQTSAATALIGLGMRSIAKEMMGKIILVGVCFFVNGLLLYIADKLPEGGKKIKNSNGFDAVIIGAVQGFCVLPGLSRMGISTGTAMALGMEKTFAIKYSLISSIPVIVGSFLVELTSIGGNSFDMDLVANYLIAMVVCAMVAICSIKIVLSLIKKYPMTGFVIYSTVVGVLSIIVGVVR